MVKTSYEVSKWAGVSYIPPDQTAYTATSSAGQQFAIYYPDGHPGNYPDVYGPNADERTPWKCVLVKALSGNGSDGTTSASTNAGSSASNFTSANGFPWQALRRGFAVVGAQLTSQAAANTGITGLGFIHLPGGVSGHYESRNRPSAIKDAVFIIQHLRFNAASYPIDSPYSYKLSGWIATFGVNSGYGLPWCDSAPSRACELGNGGPYEMNTVPNFIIATAFFPFDWLKFKNDEAATGGAFVLAETGGTGADDVVATTLAAAPQRYVTGMGAKALISDLGEPCHPKVFATSNTAPEDMNFGDPVIPNLRAVATGNHDVWHMYALKQALPKGWVELRVPQAAAYTLNATQSEATQIPTAYYDGSLNVAEAGWVAATGSVSFGANPTDGDTVTIGDGFRSVTFQFHSGGGADPGNVAITIGATAAVSMTRLLNAIASQALKLSWVAGTPSTTATNFTATSGFLASNNTWTEDSSDITVTGLENGVQGTVSITSEDPLTGYAITALVKHANDERWDKTLPPCGIRRQSQVNTTGRCIVPPAHGNGREGVWLTCTSYSSDSDLLYGGEFGKCRKRLRPGDRVWIPGTGKLFARAAGGGTQVAKYEVRECDERSK